MGCANWFRWLWSGFVNCCRYFYLCLTCQACEEDDEERQYINRPAWNRRQRTDIVNPNYKFYSNQLQSQPNGDFIDTIHESWLGNYRKLEEHHGFVQWLFPLYQSGVNDYAAPLDDTERQMILDSPEARRRILISYRLMLDFYGFRLINEDTGELEKTQNWRERFNNLNSNGHNHLRITRILKCLEIFEYGHLKAPFVRILANEIFVEKTLKSCKASCKNHWIPTLDRDDRVELMQYISSIESAESSDPI